MIPCPRCERGTVDGLLCRICTTRLRSDLLTIARLWPQLEITLARQSRRGRGGKRTEDAPLPVDAAALGVYSYTRNQLQTWVALLDLGDRPRDDPRGWALWLADRSERIRSHVDAADAAAEFHGCAGDVLRVVDLPPELLYCGSCGVCGGYLYAKPGAREVVCRRCVRAGVDVAPVGVEARRGEMRAAAEDLLVSLDELLVAVPSLYGVEVRRNTVAVWVHRGRLVSHGGLFRVGDVLDLVHGLTARSA